LLREPAVTLPGSISGLSETAARSALNELVYVLIPSPCPGVLARKVPLSNVVPSPSMVIVPVENRALQVAPPHKVTLLAEAVTFIVPPVIATEDPPFMLKPLMLASEI
jgi:hypothetical protein